MLSFDTLLGVVQPDPDQPPPGQIPSAVLMALVTMDTGDTGIILTERSAQLRNHAGQISFPGGRIDGNETPVDTALREAEEEIALDRYKVAVLGHLPGVVTTAGFHIAPVLAVIDGEVSLVPAPDEVERVLIEPLAPLLDRRRHKSVTREAGGRRYQSWDIMHEREYIWGGNSANSGTMGNTARP